jgi:hypothetical protein
MPRRESPKQKAGRKPRLENTLYRHADELKKVVSNPEAFPDAVHAISFVMCELTWLTGISIDHPDLIRTAYLECVRALHRAQESGDREKFAAIGKMLDDLDRLAHFAGVAEECRRIGRRYDDDEFREEGEAPDRRRAAIAEMLRDIYDRRSPDIGLGERQCLSRHINRLARRAGVWAKSKAELYLALAASPEADPYHVKMLENTIAHAHGTPAPPESAPRAREAKPPVTPPANPNQARIDELRKRRSELLDEAEAHNESGVFRLEREIYDLERHGDPAEWPDTIPG